METKSPAKHYVQKKFILGTGDNHGCTKEVDVLSTLFEESEKRVSIYFDDRQEEGYQHFNIQYFPYFFQGEGYTKGYLIIIINAWK